EADETESELIIGGIDPSKYTGRIGKIVSGISSIIVPFDDAYKIYQQIPNATDHDGKFVIPCESEFKVKIKIGSVDWDIDPRDLIDVQRFRNRETCSGMIMGGITD
ncbi:9154_t:CDS:2, partial [Dentiscutata erythropus]